MDVAGERVNCKQNINPNIVPNSASTHPAAHLTPYLNVKLSLLGCQPVATGAGADFGELVSTLVAQYREKERLLASHLSPSDRRIQTFLYDYLQEVPVAKLPLRTLTLDRPGMASRSSPKH